MGARAVTETATFTHNDDEPPITYKKEEFTKLFSNHECYDKILPKNESEFMASVRKLEKRLGFQTPLKWVNVIAIIALHVVTFGWFGYEICVLNLPKWQTILLGFFVGGCAGFGVTAGAHRYWCHRSYKAKLPFQVILGICYAAAGQNDIFEWVRDHRIHHKYSETPADPHDANRGFFFAHVGWLMMKKHPAVIKQGAKVDMSDITNDPFVKFHTRHFILLKLIFCFIIPTVIPPLWWGETWAYSFLSQSLLRYVLTLNFTWSVNSFAHLFGYKPYDRFIMPVENWYVSIVALGEGWHNFHHTFPWDYKAAELPYTINLTTFILDQFARIGWVYDMKTASPSLIKSVAERKGEKF